MAKPSAERSGRIVRSSGNVFADLGFADAGERQTKVRLAVAINDVLQRRDQPEACPTVYNTVVLKKASP